MIQNSFYKGLKMKRLGTPENSNRQEIIDLSTLGFNQPQQVPSLVNNNNSDFTDLSTVGITNPQKLSNKQSLEKVIFTASDITEFYISSGALAQLKFDDLKLLADGLIEEDLDKRVLVDDLRYREQNPKFLLPVLKIAELALEKPNVFADIVTSGVLNTLYSPRFDSLMKMAK